MATSVVHPDRIRSLTPDGIEPGRGTYVLYWMQRAQRAERNDALEHAARLANEHDVPLVVGFGLTADYPEATRRHYRFMLEGLSQTAAALQRRHIGVAVRLGDPPGVIEELARGAVLVVTDRAYERHLVEWRSSVARSVGVPLIQVEADVVVPVDVASDHHEYAARTIRKKLTSRIEEYAGELRATAVDRHATDVPRSDAELAGADDDRIDWILDHLGLPPEGSGDEHVLLRGGTSQARAHLDTFLASGGGSSGVGGYADRDPDPLAPAVSHLSPYLHFGQISPVFVVRAVRSTRRRGEDRDAFVEELVVRRELAINHVRHESDYDSYSALPEWARETLAEHRDDERDHVYTSHELEEGRTHDPAWNACMAEMRATGYLHNHLRMYWAKQVIGWTNTPEHAFRTLLELNNRYFLDGRDPNSFANVAWAFGLHDRAFGEREVTGKVRPMTSGGLDRKFDVDAWLADVRSRLGDAAVDGPNGEALDASARTGAGS